MSRKSYGEGRKVLHGQVRCCREGVLPTPIVSEKVLRLGGKVLHGEAAVQENPDRGESDTRRVRFPLCVSGRVGVCRLCALLPFRESRTVATDMRCNAFFPTALPDGGL